MFWGVKGRIQNPTSCRTVAGKVITQSMQTDFVGILQSSWNASAQSGHGVSPQAQGDPGSQQWGQRSGTVGQPL